ncbi:MAG: hypothetical protein L0216_17735 [Planctomycetales bacterium]|nr:hypothetical protein [Planctomycetales bacterium]
MAAPLALAALLLWPGSPFGLDLPPDDPVPDRADGALALGEEGPKQGAVDLWFWRPALRGGWRHGSEDSTGTVQRGSGLRLGRDLGLDDLDTVAGGALAIEGPSRSPGTPGHAVSPGRLVGAPPGPPTYAQVRFSLSGWTGHVSAHRVLGDPEIIEGSTWAAGTTLRSRLAATSLGLEAEGLISDRPRSPWRAGPILGLRWTGLDLDLRGDDPVAGARRYSERTGTLFIGLGPGAEFRPIRPIVLRASVIGWASFVTLLADNGPQIWAADGVAEAGVETRWGPLALRLLAGGRWTWLSWDGRLRDVYAYAAGGFAGVAVRFP